MKKKLLCLMLSVLMLLSCLMTACTPKENEEGKEDAVDNSAKTIVMWVVTNEETTPYAMEKVNEAFTKITKAKFKTNVVLKFCTEDEYYAKLEEAINANEADRLLKEEHDKALRVYLKNHKDDTNSNGEVKTKDELTADFYVANPKYAKFQNVVDEDEENVTVAEEETIKNEYGIVEIKYPEAKENQVDIFYLSGYDKYMKYYQDEWLASLDEELKTASKKITHYVSKSLLDGVQIDGSVYAIPNNVAIGEYTYMLIDKALYESYFQKIDGVQSVLDLGTFLNDVSKGNKDEAGNALSPDDPNYIVPLASTFEECMSSLVWYWEMFYTDKSVYETYLDENGRSYVLNKFYEVKEEAEEEDKEAKVKTYSTTIVHQDMVYKTNADGKLVDKGGNVLNYSYVVDAEKSWYKIPGKNEDDKPTFSDTDGKKAYTGGMYLVDEDGTPITPANDKRVVIANASYEPLVDENGKYEVDKGSIFTVDADGTLRLQGCVVEFAEDIETRADSYGNQKPTYYYGYEKSPNFSALGSLQTKPALRTRGGIALGFNNLFAQSNYQKLLTTLLSYEYNSFYGEVQEGQRAAVSFVKGDARIKLDYEEDGVYVDPNTNREYHVVVAAYPEATEQELYGNMFAVYANSPNISRSMEVITYLNTNTQFRNLLQYGIEGQHYEINKVTEKNEKGEDVIKETVTLLPGVSDDEKKDKKDQYGIYSMDIEKTGNCFIATPTQEMGGANAWDYAKIQNNDSLVAPLMGFDFNMMVADEEYGIDVTLIDQINQASAQMWNKVMMCEDLEGLEEEMHDGLEIIKKCAKLIKATNGAYDPNMPNPEAGADQPADLSGHSPYTVYNNWLTRYGYAP